MFVSRRTGLESNDNYPLAFGTCQREHVRPFRDVPLSTATHGRLLKKDYVEPHEARHDSRDSPRWQVSLFLFYCFETLMLLNSVHVMHNGCHNPCAKVSQHRCKW
jgi:hypothetical protein